MFKRKNLQAWLAVAALLALVGCNREQSEPKPEVPRIFPTQILLSEPIAMHRVEVAGEVLPIWRQFAAQKPTLLLLSGDPMLTPIPEKVRTVALDVVTKGSPAELVERSRPWSANPLFLPGMTLDLALRAGWFAQFVWALPIPDPALHLSGDTFLRQMHEGGFLDKGEAIGFGVSENRLRGVLRKTSLVATALPNLPQLTGPVVVHVDLSYFQMMYKNEKESPLVPLIVQTLKTLREKKLPILAVTFSYGNLDQRVPLDLRFAGELLGYYLADPQASDRPLPEVWETYSRFRGRQDDPDYAERERSLALEKLAPKLPWAEYGLYESAMTAGDGATALNHLQEAVAADRVYALEYLSLAAVFVDAGREKDGMRMLELAREAFPDNLNIQLLQARLALRKGERQAAATLIKQLQGLAWSETFFPDMPRNLAVLATQAKED